MTAVLPSPSGLADVDRQWGGLASGRAYLLVGRAGAGRSGLALQTVRAAVDVGERCLVISPRAPEELVEIGHEAGLDLVAAHAAGRLRLLRIPKPADLAARGPEGLAKSYRDLVALVVANGPGRVVIEDFTPLVQFDTFERFHDAFDGLVTALREQGVTLVIGLGDPANDASRRLLGVVEGLVDGTIRLEADGGLVLGTTAHARYPSSDGASVEAEPPPRPPDVPAAPLAVAPVPPPPSDDVPPAAPPPLPPPAPPSATIPAVAPARPPAPAAAPLAEGFSTTFAASFDAASAGPAEASPSTSLDGPPATEVVSPPAPDPSLLAPPDDLLGHDPADVLIAQGYLADSNGGEPAPPPSAAATARPAFAPLTAAPAPDPRAAFRTTLDAAFGDRASGTPFMVVALRMDPSAPDTAHFGTVEAGLRSALRPEDRLVVDASQKRAAVVLPSSTHDAGQALFAGLQAHLRATLGADADRVLQSVAAVTVPDGQPFQTPAELIRYALEG